MLRVFDLGIESIDGIFLTHEHSDHSVGLKALGESGLDIFVNEATACVLQDKLGKRLPWKVFETGTAFSYRDLVVDAFSIPHDAQDPVGYVFKSEGGGGFASVGWVTDLGYVPQLVREKIRDVECLVLEANHDLELLENDTKRPWSIKQRILGRHGHLSNEAAFEVLRGMPDAAWKQIFLAHLSRDCNRVDVVQNLCHALQKQRPQLNLTVVNPHFDALQALVA